MTLFLLFIYFWILPIEFFASSVHWWIIDLDGIALWPSHVPLREFSATQYQARLHCYRRCSSFYSTVVASPPHAHLYLMMLSSWVQGRVTTNYKKGHYILLQNDNWYFNWRRWITAMSPREQSGIPVLRYCLLLAIGYFTLRPNTNFALPTFVQQKKYYSPSGLHSILCDFPCEQVWPLIVPRTMGGWGHSTEQC